MTEEEEEEGEEEGRRPPPPGHGGIGGALSGPSLGQPPLGYSAVSSSVDAKGYSSNEAVVALSWIPDQANSLAVGTGVKWLKLFDVREQRESYKIQAHPRGAVYGVTCDPHRPNMLATFSDATEPIKIWDTRKLDPASAGPVATIRPHSDQPGAQGQPPRVLQVAWSPASAGLLATVLAGCRAVQFWDVARSSSKPVQVRSARHHSAIF